MYRHPRSKYWYITYTDTSGNRVRKSSGTTDRQEAERIEAKARIESHQRRKLGVQSYTFDELMLLYLEQVTPTKKSASRDAEICNLLFPYFTGKRIDEIRAKDITAYKDARKPTCQNSTIRRELALASAAVNWARRELEWDVPNPFAKRLPAVRRAEIRWMTREQADRLLAYFAKDKRLWRVYDFTIIGLYTGMRPAEILGLTESRIDLNQGIAYMRPEDQKSGEPGTVPLHDKAIEAIKRRQAWKEKYGVASDWLFCTSKGEHCGTFRKTFARGCQKVGIQGISVKNLRHTCASWMLHEGVRIEWVSRVLRHASIEITLRHYGHLRMDEARQAVNALK